MNPQPTLHTNRLLLRPLRPEDGPTVEALSADENVRRYSDPVPPLYPDGPADAWVASLAEAFAAGQNVTLAMVLRETDELIGVISLMRAPQHERAELGYWLGVPFWGKGYASEAAGAMVRYGFAELGLQRLFAQFLGSNRGSGRVLEKVGLRHEGTLRRHVRRHGRWEDLELYGMLREEWTGV